MFSYVYFRHLKTESAKCLLLRAKIFCFQAILTVSCYDFKFAGNPGARRRFTTKAGLTSLYDASLFLFSEEKLNEFFVDCVYYYLSHFL